MRFLTQEKAKEKSFHTDSDISVKIGKNVRRTLRLHVDIRLSTGVHLPFKSKLQEVYQVKLNGYILTNKIDYYIHNHTAISFTFNLISSDKIEIEGLT